MDKEINEKEINTISVFSELLKPLDLKLDTILIELDEMKSTLRNLIL